MGYFFTRSNGLWRTDGTSDGTYRLLNAIIEEHVVIGGLLYFTDRGGLLYRTDGTRTGTLQLARQSITGALGEDVMLFEQDSQLVAITKSGAWTSDGSRVRTRQLESFDGEAKYALKHDGKLHVFVNTEEATEWWQTDGTRDGTAVFDTLPLVQDTPVFHEGTLYFAAIHPQLGDELWRYVAEEETLPGDINDDGGWM